MAAWMSDCPSRQWSAWVHYQKRFIGVVATFASSSASGICVSASFEKSFSGLNAASAMLTLAMRQSECPNG